MICSDYLPALRGWQLLPLNSRSILKFTTMSTITVEVRDVSKRKLLLALLAELDFVRVVEEATATNSSSPMVVEEPSGAPWSGHELELKPATTFSQVVQEQGNKKIAFKDIAGSWEGASDEVSLEELLAAAK